MGKIQVLDTALTNLIAAGEVVERISSVVKELVENAIDASATKIKISLTDSGLSEIRVSDNGTGMDARDAKMAVLPHATSKIKSRDDLFSIHTLGFRGEALASIASISNFKIITSQDGYHGIMVTWRGGVLVTEATVSRPRGTDIIVKNLFYNTPVRLQSLQSQNVELGYVIDYVSKMALARPNVSFELINNDKLIVSSFGTNDVLETIYSIYGQKVAKNMLSIYDDNGLYKIEGFISKIAETRSTKNNIVLTINGRVIRNNSIINSIVSGYDNKLMLGRYPIALINIKVDASMVDVNVHPSKLEVRFSGEDKLKEMITNAVRNALSEADLSVLVEDGFYNKYEDNTPESKNSIANTIDSLNLYPEKANNHNDDNHDDNHNDNHDEQNDNQSDFIDDNNDNDTNIEDNTSNNEVSQSDDVPFEYENLFSDLDENVTDLLKEDYELNSGNLLDEEELESDENPQLEIDEETHKSLYLNEDITQFETILPENRLESVEFDAKEAENGLLEKINSSKVHYEQLNLDEELNLSNNSNNDEGTAQKLPNLNYIGQLFGTYVLASDENLFYLIDQHAAMERINYEKIKKELLNSNTLTYDLLVPFSIEFGPADFFKVKEKMEVINSLGITLEEFGNDTYIVRSIPTWIFRGREKEFVEEIVTKIINDTQNIDYNKAYFLDSLAKSLACKKSIKGNEYHSYLEVEYLLDELSVTENPYTCPHGRPVIIKLSKEEIEKWFKRIV